MCSTYSIYYDEQYNNNTYLILILYTIILNIFQAYPLDMSQYNSLFNNTRIPMANQDVLHNNTSSKHIVVMRRGHFYKFDVLDNQGTYTKIHY